VADFLAQIEHHLRRVQSIESSDAVDADKPPAWSHHDAVAVAALTRLEAEHPTARTQLDFLHRLWRPHATAHFVEETHWELLSGFGASLSWEIRRTYVDTAIEVAIAQDLQIEKSINIPRAHARRLSDLVRRLRADTRHPSLWLTEPWAWWNAARYCDRLGLARVWPRTPAVTVAGLTWLRLTGLDRLRWLTALEGVRRGTALDEWCIEFRGAEIVQYAGHRFELEEASQLPHRLMWSNVARWEALGAIRTWEPQEDGSFGYDLTETGKQLFGNLDEAVQHAFEAMAQSQSQVERNEIMRDYNQEAEAEVSAAMRHARLVAHEVRNALMPIRYALDKVWATVDRTGVAGTLVVPREQIEGGVSRLYRFIEASVKMSSVVEDVAVSFSLLDVIEEARRALSMDFAGSIRVETLPGTANPKIHGHRGRAVLAILNILRNAMQNGGPTVQISILVDARDSATTHLMFTDDGPGIPEQLRERLFEPGVSGRPDGAGQGLALVREVVERDLGGKVACEPVDVGARFHIELPTTQEKS
jgi:signal transduction histidine kinase